MSQPSGRAISVVNQGGFAMTFSVRWNYANDGDVKGESDKSPVFTNGFAKTIAPADDSTANIAPGDGMYPVAHIEGGVTHAAGDNVTYDPLGGIVTYTITGGLANPSFHQQG